MEKEHNNKKKKWHSNVSTQIHVRVHTHTHLQPFLSYIPETLTWEANSGQIIFITSGEVPSKLQKMAFH